MARVFYRPRSGTSALLNRSVKVLKVPSNPIVGDSVGDSAGACLETSGRQGLFLRERRAPTAAWERSQINGFNCCSRVGTSSLTVGWMCTAREAGETQGFMKVLVDAETQRILGAAILGLNGDEVVHGLLDIMAANQPYTVISRAVHIHPTVSELVPTLLQQLKPLI